MADRNSAEIFSMFFQYLAEDPEKNRQFAHDLWKKTYNYDFDFYQMHCDDALIKLGLAWEDGADGYIAYKE